MKEKLATNIGEFIQEYFDAWREGITEKILTKEKGYKNRKDASPNNRFTELV